MPCGNDQQSSLFWQSFNGNEKRFYSADPWRVASTKEDVGPIDSVIKQFYQSHITSFKEVINGATTLT